MGFIWDLMGQNFVQPLLQNHRLKQYQALLPDSRPEALAFALCTTLRTATELAELKDHFSRLCL